MTRPMRFLLSGSILFSLCVSLPVWSADRERLTGRLPAGYGKLGLSDSQKQAAYRIQRTYQEKINLLETMIAKAKEEEKNEIAKLLTPAQRALLREQEAAKEAKLAEKKKADN